MGDQVQEGLGEALDVVTEELISTYKLIEWWFQKGSEFYSIGEDEDGYFVLGRYGPMTTHRLPGGDGFDDATTALEFAYTVASRRARSESFEGATAIHEPEVQE